MKIKVGFTGLKKCPSGEIYKFKKGSAIVPGITIERKLVVISLKEFNELILEKDHEY